jgi:HEAT repeat protein
LIGLLSDKKKQVRKHSALALGLLGDDRALAPLEKIAGEDPDDKVKAAAALAVRMIRSKSGAVEEDEPVDSTEYKERGF